MCVMFRVKLGIHFDETNFKYLHETTLMPDMFMLQCCLECNVLKPNAMYVVNSE